MNGSSNAPGYTTASIMFQPSAPANQDTLKVCAVDLFLLVQTDAGAQEMRAKTKGVKSVYIVLTQQAATQYLKLGAGAERDTSIS